jgi:cell division septum initiation protein DivIVA
MEAAEQLSLMTTDSSRLAELAPLNIIRTETVFSKLPVHCLSKKGRVDIRILQKGAKGDVRLKWQVSFNERYGQARQLAYKLETLVINRRIDESPRPLPIVIRIGSLKEVCKYLGVTESGKNVRDLRIAFLQNASAFIDAQLNYRDRDGVERRIEAGFTRYGVVFTGEKLPDGRSADAVYITLNTPYWEVVNSAPFRPLNYDYLKQLAPASQRFYEILSYRIFAALKNGRPEARISYSDYCTFSAQKRHYEHEGFRVQMYKVQKPHLDSGYLKSVSVQATVDGEGKSDWVLTYTPGPKAEAEYRTFTSKPEERQEIRKQASNAVLTAPTAPQSAISEEAEVDNENLEALKQRGIAEARARTLLSSLPKEQPILDQLEWADFLLREAAVGKFRNPAGLYFSILRDNIPLPPGFESSRRRQLRLEAEQTRQQEQLERQRVQWEYEAAYDEYKQKEAERRFLSLSEDDRQERVLRKKKEFRRVFQQLPAETLEDIAVRTVRTELLSEDSVLSFAEFCREQQNGL